MKKLTLLLLSMELAVSAIAIQTASAAPTLRHYWVRVAQTDRSCDQEAQLLADRFARASHLQVKIARCLGTFPLQTDHKVYPLYSLDVTYLADASPSIYQALFGRPDATFHTPSDLEGIYPTMDACLGDLSRQSTSFQKQTGLEVLSARCEPSKLDGATKVMKIDGIGTPAQRLNTFSPDFLGIPTQELIRQTRALVGTMGGTTTGIWGDHIFYYSPNRLSLHTDWLGSSVASQCVAQMEEVRSMHQKLGATTVIVNCLPLSEAPGARAAMNIVHNAASVVHGDAYGSAHYFSFEECMANKDRAVQDAVSSGRKPPLGALCREDLYNSEQFVIEFFDSLY